MFPLRPRLSNTQETLDVFYSDLDFEVDLDSDDGLPYFVPTHPRGTRTRRWEQLP